MIEMVSTMIEIPAGRFAMGSTGFYAEEGPVREVEVDAFAIDPARCRWPSSRGSSRRPGT